MFSSKVPKQLAKTRRQRGSCWPGMPVSGLLFRVQLAPALLRLGRTLADRFCMEVYGERHIPYDIRHHLRRQAHRLARIGVMETKM